MAVAYSRYENGVYLKRTEEPGKSEVGIGRVPITNRTKRLFNTGTDSYRYIKLFCAERMRSFSDPNETPGAKFVRNKRDKSSTHHLPILLPFEVRLNYLSIYI